MTESDKIAVEPSPNASGATFQRARRPEQREARRQAILDVAEAMLARDATSEISLREISRRVGLATSNVLRYFESREAIFLELLARESTSWLDALEPELARSSHPAASRHASASPRSGPPRSRTGRRSASCGASCPACWSAT
jgi:AcrR family transcriptional regulator